MTDKMSSSRLEPGDLAIILNSVTGKSIGRIVTCIAMEGEHVLFGRIWLVESDRPLQVVSGDVLRRAHVPEKWLKKIPKDPLEGDDEKLEIDNLILRDETLTS